MTSTPNPDDVVVLYVTSPAPDPVDHRVVGGEAHAMGVTLCGDIIKAGWRLHSEPTPGAMACAACATDVVSEGPR